jgi:hypothetical protein
MAIEDIAGGKGLASAVMICELWRLAVMLQLLAVPSRVHKWSINPFTHPYPVDSDNIVTIY